MMNINARVLCELTVVLSLPSVAVLHRHACGIDIGAASHWGWCTRHMDLNRRI